MNVLSLFDGMSCGQQALERAGIKVDNYFASEIDKYAIQVTMANYPETIQLGSVIDIDTSKLPQIDLLIGGSPCQSFSFAGKRKGMSTKDNIEILTLAHYLKLKDEGYEFEGQSYLFWEYIRIMQEVKPKYFLLENVMMGEKWERVISKTLGVNPVEINSSLVSAQNRRRLYWTNIGMVSAGLFGDMESIIKQPKDVGILLKDILQDNPNAKYYVSEKLIAKINRTNNGDKCLAAGYYKQGRDNQYVTEQVHEKYYLSERMVDGFIKHNENHIKKGTGFIFTPTEGYKKGNTLRANGAICATDNSIIVHNTQKRSANRPSIQKNKNAGGSGHLSRTDGKTYALDTGNTNAVEIVAMRGRQNEDGKYEQQLETREDEKTNTLTSVSKDNLIREVKQVSTNNKSNGGTQPYQQDRIYDIDGISPALSAGKSDLMITSGTLRTHKDGEGFREIQSGKGATIPARAREDGSGQNVVSINSRIRRLTPIECERLQTVPDNYTNHVSDSQRYKMLGNGWTIEVIAHIFLYLNK